MLVRTLDSTVYVAEFKKRFSNFCEKSPILLSYVVSEARVDVIIEDTDEVLSFQFDYTIDVKTFIFGIRQILIERAYPIITKIEEKSVPLSMDEQMKLAETGTPVDELPRERVEKTSSDYLIDRVIIYKDIFILKEISSGRMFRYQLNSSSVFFLKKLKSGRMTKVEGATFFFENATLLNELVSA